MPDVVVIGAGVSGLTCAWRLQRAGLEVVVLESGDRPGGVIASHEIGGCLVESGPNTILPTPQTLEIIRDAGLTGALVPAPSRAPRFIYLDGRLRRVPWVLSASGFLRAMAEPFVPPRRGGEDESLRSFFTRRFGRQLHDRLAAPFIGGIFAGDTGSLGLEATFPRLRELERRHRSVILGMLRSRGPRPAGSLSSFRRGMRMLPEGLSRGLNIRCRIGDLKLGDGRIDLAGESIRSRVQVLAVPAYAAARLLGGMHKPLSALLDSVYYAPLIVAATSVEATQLPARLEGFGFLVPRGQGVRMLGSLFSSALFPGRSPDGTHLLTSFLGGALDPEISGWSDDRVWETVAGELASILGLTGSPAPVGLFRYRRAIPQYRVGHSRWRHSVEECLDQVPGLFLTGSYLEGVSVPASMEHGRRTGDRILDYVRRQG